MIVERAAGRTDSGICCPECGLSPLWQPLEFSACVDPWWCKDCRRFWQDGDYDACGSYPYMIAVDNGTNFPTEMRPACGGPVVPIQRKAA